MRYLRPLLALLLITFPLHGRIVADGVAFVPVVVFVTYGDTGITKGLDVRLVEAGEDSPPDDNPPPLRNLHSNLGKPVLTDHNSTAVVWMLARWSSSGGAYHRAIRGRLILGPPDAPLFDARLREIVEDPKKAESSSVPIFVTVKLKKAS